MPTPRENLFIKLRNNNAYRKKNERIFEKGLIVKKDIKIVYETTFLLGFIAFENFIEEQFLHLLTNGLLSTGKKSPSLVTYRNKPLARNFVYAGRSYINWLPYDSTKKIAKSFFKDGVPFANIGRGDVKLLYRYHLLRNAIAHQSTHSQKRLEEEFVLSSILRPSERTPSGFLRSIVSARITQYEVAMSEFQRIALLIDQ